MAVNDYDSLFATGLGVIGTISTNFNYNNAGAALPAGSGGPRAYRFFETEVYFGDTWKVTKKLTLSYGLRYQLYSVPYEAKGDESVPITTPASGIDLDTFIKDRIGPERLPATRAIPVSPSTATCWEARRTTADRTCMAVLKGLCSPLSLCLHPVQLPEDRHQWRRGHCL